MKIPLYQNQVSATTVNAAHPVATEPLRTAFGEQVPRATQHLASTLGQLATTAGAIGVRKEHERERAAAQQQAQQEREQAEKARSEERANQRARHLRKTAALLNWQKDNDALLYGKLAPNGQRVEGGLMSKQYSAANGITGAYQQEAQKLMQQYLDQVQDPEEKQDLALELQGDFQQHFNRVAAYELKQQRETGNLLTTAYTQNKLREIAQDPQQLDTALARATQQTRANLTANATPAPLQEVQIVALNNQAVSVAVNTLLEREQAQEATQIFEKYKDKIDTSTAKTLAKALFNQQLGDLKTQWAQYLDQNRTASGEIDFAGAQKALEQTGFDDKIQQELLKFTKTRLKDEQFLRQQQQQARDENFYQQVDQWDKNNQTLQQGLQLAQAYANGSKDKLLKEKFIRQYFDEKQARTHAKQSDPEEYLRLYKGVLNGEVGQNELKQSFEQNFITAADFRALSKELVADPNGKQERAFALKQIEADAYAKVPDADERRRYVLEVQRQSQGKTIPEMFAIAEQLLGKTGGFLFWGNMPKYQRDSERNAEQQRTLGNYLQHGGDLDTFNAFIQYTQNTQAQGHVWSADDWERFKQQFPNIEKKGSPENTALLSLAAQDKPISAQNLNTVIDVAYALDGQKSPRQTARARQTQEFKQRSHGNIDTLMRLMPFAQDEIEENYAESEPELY